MAYEHEDQPEAGSGASPSLDVGDGGQPPTGIGRIASKCSSWSQFPLKYTAAEPMVPVRFLQYHLQQFCEQRHFVIFSIAVFVNIWAQHVQTDAAFGNATYKYVYETAGADTPTYLDLVSSADVSGFVFGSIPDILYNIKTTVCPNCTLLITGSRKGPLSLNLSECICTDFNPGKQIWGQRNCTSVDASWSDSIAAWRAAYLEQHDMVNDSWKFLPSEIPCCNDRSIFVAAFYYRNVRLLGNYYERRGENFNSASYLESFETSNTSLSDATVCCPSIRITASI